MSSKECKEKLSPICFWDVDKEQFEMDAFPAHIIPRVLEYGTLDDWRLIRSYYGMDKIVEVCQHVRTLDPVSLAFVCAMSDTKKEDYRCYHFRQSSPTLWNS
ncbi:MAG: hypothetical protein IKO85_06925 [Bacteroidaceae bacterium]|nr:hypothetical protein [Bacteroidaceae bacterium]